MSLRGRETFNDMSCNRQTADFEYLFPAEAMAELRRYVDDATRLAVEEPYKTRVGWVRMGFLEPQGKRFARYLAQRKTTAAQRPRRGVCYRFGNAPAVDGDSTDNVWSGVPLYFLNDWRTGARPAASTWFRMGYDDAFLYVLVRCDDPNAAGIRVACRGRDGSVYLDDCVELHLTFESAKTRRFQILVNSVGTVQDFQHTVNEAGVDASDLSWNCDGLKAAAQTDANGYTVEVGVPLAAIDGAAASGTMFHANVCRERYSGGDQAQLQAWSVTQTGFADGRYFGRIVMTEGDAWRRFFNEKTPSSGAVLYRVDKNHPWTLDRSAIRAVPEQDSVRYEMACPKVADDGRVYAGFSVRLDPPVQVSPQTSVEVAFHKADPDVMLELIYNYASEEGKEASNYFIFSPWGDFSAAPQLFVRQFADGHERDRPAPRMLKSVTVYGVVSGAKTPTETNFALHWIRVCGDTLQRQQP